ncbi:MAG: endonuclease V [Cytophagales bacterium]|nr:endonuclease V [Cytophagales bacterium]
MILAFDTYYNQDKAKTVCVAFENWKDVEPGDIYEEILEGIAAYEPGAFYKRELPCILSLLEKIHIKKIDTIIVDGFVFLDDAGKLGLGGHLHHELSESIPVIGVAKSKFSRIENDQKELFRGESKKPLYITAIGTTLDTAFDHIKSMHGNFRMPTLLQLLDQQTKALD